MMKLCFWDVFFLFWIIQPVWECYVYLQYIPCFGGWTSSCNTFYNVHHGTSFWSISRSREALKRTGGENHGLWTQWSPGWTQRSRSSLRLEAEAMCCDCGGDSRMGDSLDWFKEHFKTLYRKTKYLMVKTMVSCPSNQSHWQIQPRHENIGFNLNLKERTNDVIRMGKMMLSRLI